MRVGRLTQDHAQHRKYAGNSAALRHAFVSCFLLVLTGWAQAQPNDLSSLKIIQETVQEICQTPNRRGEYLKVEGDGTAGVSIGILKLIGRADVSANAKFTKEEWDGVRKVLDQNAENASYRDCATKLTPLFLEKFTKPSKNSRSFLRETLPNSVKIAGRFVRYTQWLDGTQTCWNGSTCATAVLTLQNRSDIGFDAAIKHGSSLIGSCAGRETESAGLKLYDTNPGWTNNIPLNAALSFIPPRATIPVTIRLENCSSNGTANVDVAISLTVVADDQLFNIPLSAFDVPIR